MEAHRGGAPLAEVLAHRPTAGSPVLLRELAAIHRQVRRGRCGSLLRALLATA